MMGKFSISFILVLSSLAFLLLSLLSSATADSIKQHGSIKDGETIISSGEVFELGFFGPNNSENRYVGIWYHQIPGRSIVWVANRENPLADSSGMLTISRDGNLVILDGRNITIWSTNASIPVNSTLATLLDSGNLVLRDGTSNNSDTILWQSFDHPTDTLLPGMKIGIDIVAQRNRFLQSWKSSADPSPGNFTFGLDPKDANQFFIWHNFAPYWRSGYWNRRTFNLPPVVSNTYVFHFTTISNEEGIYIEYSALYNNTKLRMDASGDLQCRIWSDATQTWNIAWMQPKDQCGPYASCGKNSRCSDYNTPMCECFLGFEPVSQKEWNSGTWSGGCKRRKSLECGQRDKFFSLGKLKVPDHEVVVRGVESAENCIAECVSNCSCIAYTFVNASNDGGLSQCLVWSGDLMDIADLKENEGAHVVYLRIASSELSTNKHKRVAVTVAVPVIAGVLLLGALFCCLRRMLKKKGAGEQMSTFCSPESSTPCASDFLDASKLAKDRQKWTDIPFFEFSTLAAATNNFSLSNMLGEGGFGPVYKGKLPGGQEIAVKRLSRCSGQGLQEFETEVKVIAKLQHRNLVRLLGYGIQGYEKMLIYEYMPNKSLDWFLFDKDRSWTLDWEKRFSIILGIARGLLYLHQDSRLRIIHRDLKPSNVLLDEEMNPKISDFGLARIVGGKQTQECTKRVVGTYGYMSPEYASHGLFSVKSDVFSFGVILLEILSGMKCNNFSHPDESSSLPEHAWGLWKEGNALALADPATREKCDTDELLKCIHVGLLCVQEKAADRPTMASVMAMLVSETATLPRPRQPAFIVRRDLDEIECSRNEMTFTKVEGR